MISKEKISEVVNKIALGYEPEKIILFGSYASGSPNENSDLDLLIIKDSDLPRPERSVQVRKLLFGSMIPMDLIVYTPKELEDSRNCNYNFVNEVLSSGKTLYERVN
jgi:predicted nucleotidyltransferase